jgi:colanic acid biosynthesis glycosyl transferase WcaI
LRILIHGINFSPELTGIGKYSGELSAWLASSGQDVRVVTTPPYYPKWQVASSYANTWQVQSFHSEVAVNDMAGNLLVYRCPLWVPTKPSGLKRILHLTSFILTSAPVLFANIFWKPKVIVVIEPAFFCLIPALIFSKITGAKLWLHIQDYEIDAAFNLGLIKNNFLKKALIKIESYLMSKCDRVSTISQNMLKLAKRKGVNNSHLIFFPNWADIHLKISSQDINILYKTLKIQKKHTLVLYSGNMGNKQGLESLVEAASDLKKHKDIIFIFCGEGSEKNKLVKQCTNLTNVRFSELLPLNIFPNLLHMADIHLLPQRGDVADLVMPSKLTGMLASGRPVVAIAKSGSEVALAVKGNGIVVTPDNPKKFSEAILKLAHDRELRLKLGKNARQYALNHLDKNKILHKFEQDLNQCVNS